MSALISSAVVRLSADSRFAVGARLRWIMIPEWFIKMFGVNTRRSPKYDSNLPLISNVGVGIFLWVALSSIQPIGLLMSGYASNNKYSLLGGLRAAAQSISYEIPLALAVLAVAAVYVNVDWYGLGDERWLARYNGRRALYLNVTQKEGVNIYDITEPVHAQLDELPLAGDIRLAYVFDQAIGVRDRVNGFISNLGQGIFLVGLIILLNFTDSEVRDRFLLAFTPLVRRLDYQNALHPILADFVGAVTVVNDDGSSAEILDNLVERAAVGISVQSSEPGTIVVGKRSENEFGWNVGAGYSFDTWSGGKVFIEARYQQIQFGRENLEYIPLTVGYRW